MMVLGAMFCDGCSGPHDWVTGVLIPAGGVAVGVISLNIVGYVLQLRGRRSLGNLCYAVVPGSHALAAIYPHSEEWWWVLSVIV